MSGAPAKVAIVGTGAIARAHARVAVAHPDLSLVALVGADEREGVALAGEIVQRFEGDRPRRFPDLSAALGATVIDIVALVDGTSHVADLAREAGVAVVGGPEPIGDQGSGRWFPFDAGRCGTGDDDAAFADHLRQYEGILGRIGFGPLADRAGARP